MATPIIQLDHVSKKYVAEKDAPAALNDLSLVLEEREFVGIMGQSGSGKTTLLNLVGGLDRDYSGQVTVLGRDLAAMSDGELSRFRNENIGFDLSGLPPAAPAELSRERGSSGAVSGPIPPRHRAADRSGARASWPAGPQGGPAGYAVGRDRSNESPSPARSCSSPSSCCAMSPPETSIRKQARS